MRIEQVKRLQSSVFWPKFNQFSWINASRIVGSHWLIAKVLGNSFWQFLQSHCFYKGAGFQRSLLCHSGSGSFFQGILLIILFFFVFTVTWLSSSIHIILDDTQKDACSPSMLSRVFRKDFKIFTIFYATGSSVFLWGWGLSRLKPIFLTFLVFKNIFFHNSTIIWKRITLAHLLCSAEMANALRGTILWIIKCMRSRFLNVALSI